MKKLIKSSLVSALAVVPMVAMAANEAPSTTLTINSGKVGLSTNSEGVIIAGGGAYYAGSTITDTDKVTPASAAYVKGAYNDAISAINKTAADVASIAPSAMNAADTSLSNINPTGKANVSAKGTVDLTKNDYDNNTVGKALVDIKTTADGAVQTVTVNNTALTEDNSGNVNITIDSGTAAGTISVNGSDVAVTGVLTEHQSLDNYAAKTGVTNTISASYAPVPVMETWGSDTPGTTNVTLVGGTYTTTAPATGG